MAGVEINCSYLFGEIVSADNYFLIYNPTVSH